MFPDLDGEPVTVPETVIHDWNIERVATQMHPGNLLPSNVAWAALHTAVDDVGAVLAARSTAGLRVRPVEIVHVPKLDRTTRPAADMPIEDQLIYAAIIDVLRSSTPGGFVAFSGDDVTYQAFEDFPLTVDGTRYVLEADAAGFYQFIDHERLAYELLGLTGRADGVEPLVRLLAGWLRDRRGLPQGPIPSYVLADIYISPVARALDRAGFAFSRYSDDFRVLGRTWVELKQAQALIEESFYDVGLVVAAKKLRTLKLDTYARRIRRVNDGRLDNPVIRETVDELEAADYVPGLGARRPVTAEQLIRAQAVFTLEIETDRIDVLSTRLMRSALPVLGSAANPVALEHVGRLLTRYAHITPNIATYFQLLGGTDVERDAVTSVVGWLGSRNYRYSWQEGWMLHAIAHSRTAVEAVQPEATRVLRSGDSAWFARGQAAIALAVHGGFPSQREFVSVYEHAPVATRVDLIAAVRIADPGWSASFLRGAADTRMGAAVAALSPESFLDWI